MEMSGQRYALATLLPGKESPFTHWIEGWVGSRASLDMVVIRKNPFPLLGIKPLSSSL